MTKLFPIILIALNLAASLVYAFHNEWKMAIYWLSAAVLNICVTI